jgi:hypothetical protein
MRTAVRITPHQGVYVDSYMERIYVFRCLGNPESAYSPYKVFMQTFIRILSPFRCLCGNVVLQRIKSILCNTSSCFINKAPRKLEDLL